MASKNSESRTYTVSGGQKVEGGTSDGTESAGNSSQQEQTTNLNPDAGKPDQT